MLVEYYSCWSCDPTADRVAKSSRVVWGTSTSLHVIHARDGIG